MTWYLIAIVMFSWSATPDIKINTALSFRNFEMCDEYHNTYKESLEKGLQRAYPQALSIDIKCKGM